MWATVDAVPESVPAVHALRRHLNVVRYQLEQSAIPAECVRVKFVRVFFVDVHDKRTHDALEGFYLAYDYRRMRLEQTCTVQHKSIITVSTRLLAPSEEVLESDKRPASLLRYCLLYWYYFLLFLLKYFI